MATKVRVAVLAVCVAAASAVRAETPPFAATLLVVVADPQGDPLPSAFVSACSNGPLGYTEYSDRTGTAGLHIPPLTYAVSVSLPGFLAILLPRVALLPGASVSLYVAMELDRRSMGVVTTAP